MGIFDRFKRRSAPPKVESEVYRSSPKFVNAFQYWEARFLEDRIRNEKCQECREALVAIAKG